MVDIVVDVAAEDLDVGDLVEEAMAAVEWAAAEDHAVVEAVAVEEASAEVVAAWEEEEEEAAHLATETVQPQ